MALKKVTVNGETYYLETETRDGEDGALPESYKKEKIDNTLEFEPFTDEDLLGNTNTDIFGDKDE